MKIIFVAILCLILVGITSYSYAQYTEVDSHTILPEVMLQLELRDSDGNLITYIEGVQIIEINPFLINRLLDDQNYKEYLIKDGKAYEVIQWQGRTEIFHIKDSFNQFTLWILEEDMNMVGLTVRHNAYETQPGDTITVYWTVIRPAN